jgi:hypothetical protein
MKLTPDQINFMERSQRSLPTELAAFAAAARPGGALEALLRGTLESFAERSFRTYRHLRAAASLDSGWSANK